MRIRAGLFPAVALFLLMFGAVAAGAPTQRVRVIQSPLFSVPVIITAGGSFKMKLALPEGAALESVELQGIGKPAVEIHLKTAQAADEGSLKVFTVIVPASTPEALYNLAVEYGENDWDYQPHSVKVVKKIKTDFDFVQLTDIHFNIQEVKGGDMNRIRRRLLQDLSELNPEFVIFTGDLGLYPATYNVDYVYGYEEMLQWLRVPMFMVPGNHEQYYFKSADSEIDGREYWAGAYGPTYHSFDYGKMHFVGINDYDWPRIWREHKAQHVLMSGALINAMRGQEQWDWLQADLAASAAAGKSCVAYSHIPIGTMQGGRRIGFPPKQLVVPGPNTEQFTDALRRGGCTNIFIGHMHYNRINTFGTLTEVLTEAAGIGPGVDGGKYGYRIIHVKNGKITGWDIHQIGFNDLNKTGKTAPRPKGRAGKGM